MTNESISNKILETMLNGLLQLKEIEITKRPSVPIDGTSRTHVSFTLPIPSLYGGQGSIYLNMLLPPGETELLAFFHSLNLSLVSLVDSLSMSLNMVQSSMMAHAITEFSSSQRIRMEDGTTRFKTMEEMDPDEPSFAARSQSQDSSEPSTTQCCGAKGKELDDQS